MRVSDRYQQHRTLAQLREQAEQLQRAQDRVASGLKVQTLSDDPVGSPVLRLVREALDDHINQRLENPEMKERYEAARKARIGLPDKVVTLIRKPSQPKT